ncbi:hypothetical protein POM88_028424 [Heracleum sosnowskyi]|uniref:RING-type domain-containing protein n=1 Tax=Heracleum sosnowskyi TaxID=360622 RepID=A0AAD8HS76_9APIA|nr:hypothetical protein POM88_028424 [Heracleum sosnowskyi]
MQSDKLTDKGNPDASAFPLTFENSEFGLPGCDDYNGVADFTCFHQLPLPVDPFPWEDANLSYHSNKQEISSVSACRFLNPEAQSGYQMNRQCGDANTPTIARPWSSNHSASLQSRFLLHSPDRNPQIKAVTDANMDETGSLMKIHGSFLSLGPESDVDNRSSTDKGNLAASASTGLISRHFHILQTPPEVDMPQNMLSMPNNRISNSESNRDLKYDTIQGDQLASSSAYSSSSTAFPLSGQNRVTTLASRSQNRTGTATGIAPHQLYNIESSQNLSLSSILYPRLLRTGERGVQHGHSGVSIAHDSSLDDAAVRNVLPDINKFQSNKYRPAVDTGVVFPERHGIQGTMAQAPQGSSIPIDRGVLAASKYCKSFNDIPVYRDLHVSSAYGQSPGMLVLPSAKYGGSLTESGPPQSSLPIQNWRPMSTTGQGLPVANINEDLQNYEILNRSSLKRGAVQSPLDATWVHHKKLAHNPTIPPSTSYKPIPPSTSCKPIPPSMPYKAVPPSSGKPVLPGVSFKPQKAPALLPSATTAHPSMSALPYIKWQGIDEQPEPTGDKCLICRRDLIFSPEGPVERPPISPLVAVLHCGHTFHDICLQKITPEDQSKSPPCIPCAIGEN